MSNIAKIHSLKPSELKREKELQASIIQKSKKKKGKTLVPPQWMANPPSVLSPSQKLIS